MAKPAAIAAAANNMKANSGGNANLAALQAQRAQIINEIHRRGGKAKAPKFTQQLADIENQIRANRGTVPNDGGGDTPAPGQPAPSTPAPSQPAPGGPGGQMQPGPFDPGTSIKSDILPSQPDDVIDATSKIKASDPGTAQDAEIKAAEEEARRNFQLNNPNQSGPFGSVQYTTDEGGNKIQTTKLSDPQQKILDQGQDLTTKGQQIAADKLKGLSSDFNPTLTPRNSTGDVLADRARIEDILYKKMTRDTDRNQAVDQKKIEQDLYNKGIPYSDAEDSRYQTELRNNLKRYDTVRENAMQSAVQSGGEEYKTDVGVQELLSTNDLSHAKTIHDTNVSDVQNFSGLGTGLQTPNPLGFNGTNYNPSDPLNTFSTLTASQQLDKQIEEARRAGDLDRETELKKQKMANSTSKAIANIQARSKGGGGGGGGGTSEPSFP